jgi:hypothetical protein
MFLSCSIRHSNCCMVICWYFYLKIIYLNIPYRPEIGWTWFGPASFWAALIVIIGANKRPKFRITGKIKLPFENYILHWSWVYHCIFSSHGLFQSSDQLQFFTNKFNVNLAYGTLRSHYCLSGKLSLFIRWWYSTHDEKKPGFII